MPCAPSGSNRNKPNQPSPQTTGSCQTKFDIAMNCAFDLKEVTLSSSCEGIYRTISVSPKTQSGMLKKNSNWKEIMASETLCIHEWTVISFSLNEVTYHHSLNNNVFIFSAPNDPPQQPPTFGHMILNHPYIWSCVTWNRFLNSKYGSHFFTIT
jgi:hypothetical protein